MLKRPAGNGFAFVLLVLVLQPGLCRAQAADPASFFAEGGRALRDGHLAEAARAFHEVLRLDPASAAAHTNLGVIAMRQSRWSAALVEFRAAEQLDPGMTGVHLNKGLAYYRMRDFASAASEFAAVTAREPSSQARHLLGLSEFFEGRYREAQDALLPLWPEQQASLTYLYVLGSAAGKTGDRALEERAFRRMAEVGEGTPELHLYAGKVLLGKQDYAQAASELRAATAARPNLPMAHFFLAQAYSRQHNDEQARGQLLAELKLEPDLPFTYDELGQVLLRLGKPQEAAQAFQAALARDPSLSSSCLGLAQIDRDAQQYGPALRMLDQALALEPNSAHVHYLRGQALVRLHRGSEAQTEFTTAQDLLRRFHDRLNAGDATARAADAQAAEQAAQE